MNMKFFENLMKENDNDIEIVNQCCKQLKFRSYTKDEYVCKFREDGNEFYIIMTGSVSVLVPLV